MKRILLGHAAVDSGQLIICDPCYIDSYWKKKEFQNIQLWQHTKTKKKFILQNPQITTKTNKYNAEPFPNYTTKTSTGKSINQMIENSEVKIITIKEKIDFSYNGICNLTIKNKSYNIPFPKGHEGLAVAFSSGYGDGFYEVWGTFNKENRCMKVEILMNL